jgi:hypothetical protein
MSNKAIRTKAEELLSFGVPKQQVFDNLLLQFPEAKPRKVAEVVRYMPSLQARERYGAIHRALLITIALSAVLRIVHPLLDPDYDWAKGFKYVSLVPVATVLVGWTIYRWQGQVLSWVGWGNLATSGSLVKQVTKFAGGEVDAWNVAFAAMPVLIGVLALVLVYGAFPRFKVDKDPMGGPDRILFREDHAV